MDFMFPKVPDNPAVAVRLSALRDVRFALQIFRGEIFHRLLNEPVRLGQHGEKAIATERIFPTDVLGCLHVPSQPARKHKVNGADDVARQFAEWNHFRVGSEIEFVIRNEHAELPGAVADFYPFVKEALLKHGAPSSVRAGPSSTPDLPGIRVTHKPDPARWAMSYKFLQVEKNEHVAVVHMNRPPVNDLNIEFMDELSAVHKELDADSNTWVVVLASKSEKFFCNGLEPGFVLERTVDERGEVFMRLMDMCRNVYEFSKPEIAVIRGHAMAGGAVLGMLADLRFMGDGKYRYSFSEVRVGLTIPGIILSLVESVIGRRSLTEVCMLGEAYHPSEALAVGLVDRVVPHDTALDQAVQYARALTEYPQASLRSAKRAVRADLRARFASLTRADLEEFRSLLSGNFEEGLLAVKERRRPKFKNP